MLATGFSGAQMAHYEALFQRPLGQASLQEFLLHVQSGAFWCLPCCYMALWEFAPQQFEKIKVEDGIVPTCSGRIAVRGKIWQNPISLP